MSEIKDVKGIIYVIENLLNNKKYIGQTMSHTYNEKEKKWEKYGINERLSKHLSRASQNSDYPLYKDINEFSFKNFKIYEEIVLNSEKIINLDDIELDCIKKYNSLIPNGYNLTTNTTQLNKNKKKILDYYKQNVSRSDEYKERNNRKKHITVKISERESFFKDKTILSIKLNPIKEGSQYKFIRLIIETKEVNDYYRIQFSSNDFVKTIQTAIDYSKSLSSNLDIHPNLLDILNNKSNKEKEDVELIEKKTNDSENEIKETESKVPLNPKENKNIEIYKYQRHLEELKKKKIRKISCTKSFHKKSNNEICLLLVYLENESRKQIMFGGKNVNINDTINNVKEFLSKLNIDQNLIKLNF